jgi:predicted transcriptional regulator
VELAEEPQEPTRNPTWFSPEETKKILGKGREVKYARELQAVVDRAMEKIVVGQTTAAP